MKTYLYDKKNKDDYISFLKNKSYCVHSKMIGPSLERPLPERSAFWEKHLKQCKHCEQRFKSILQSKRSRQELIPICIVGPDMEKRLQKMIISAQKDFAQKMKPSLDKQTSMMKNELSVFLKHLGRPLNLALFLLAFVAILFQFFS